MNSHSSRYPLFTAAFVAAALLIAAADAPAATSASESSSNSSSTSSDTASDAKERVSDAERTIEQLKREPQLAKDLARAKGVFVIPRYGKGALIVGGQGGGGVVLARREGNWSAPAFFSIGGASIGAQAGGEGGSVVLLLMTDKAVNKFANTENTWALNANAGLTVVTWSGKGQVQTGKGDVIVWTDTKGLYGGLTASVTDITPDKDMDRAYYGRTASSQEILSGNISAPNATPLREALAMRVASK